MFNKDNHKTVEFSDRKHIGSVPFISCEKEWNKWIDRHSKYNNKK